MSDSQWIYCDRDPRQDGCKYWRTGHSGERSYISEREASRLIMAFGWGLKVTPEPTIHPDGEK